MKKQFLILSVLLASTVSQAADELSADFDSLGGNEVLLEKAQALNPDAQINVVQNRIVSRENRFEIAPEASAVFGGDAYNRTQNVAMNVHYHINPHWSVGLKYAYSFNQLTPEGKELTDKAEADIAENPANPNIQYPQVDYPKSQALAMVNWYPIYGKMSFYSLGVTHFDFYTTAGYGQVELKSGNTSTYVLGAGIGFWFSQHLTTRLEALYQTYEAQYRTGNKKMDMALGSVQIGWLL